MNKLVCAALAIGILIDFVFLAAYIIDERTGSFVYWLAIGG